MQYVKQDISSVASGLIIHSVACQGNIGNDRISQALVTQFPMIVSQYMRRGAGKHLLGTADFVQPSSSVVIANCYTMVNRDNPSMGGGTRSIRESLTKVFNYAKQRGMKVFMTKISNCSSNVYWEKSVRPIIRELESQYNCSVSVCIL